MVICIYTTVICNIKLQRLTNYTSKRDKLIVFYINLFRWQNTFVTMSEWYKTWFDSEYYHLLYKDRDHTEAENFIQKIYQYLTPAPHALMLDLACGKGRHSIHLQKMGAIVEGCDYSENSIQHAKQFENNDLCFYTHDMRNPLPKKYDYIFNLFTSFGYFDTLKEHQQTLNHIYTGLNDNGTFVFDFMNIPFILDQLISHETVTKGPVEFNIIRKEINGTLQKHISFKDNGQHYTFTEEVAAFRPDEIMAMMKKAGFAIQDTFGDYALSSYHSTHSKRFILIATK